LLLRTKTAAERMIALLQLAISSWMVLDSSINGSNSVGFQAAESEYLHQWNQEC
jgi:hypothetical protein